MYEFQAWDRFWRVVRGRIAARSRSKARRILKSRHLRFPILIWPEGREPWIAALGKIRSFGGQRFAAYKHAPMRRLRRNDPDTLVYAVRRLWKWGVGIVFSLAGAVFVGAGGSGLVTAWHRRGGRLGWLRVPDVWFLLGIGSLFLIVGLIALCARFEVHVHRPGRLLTLRGAIVPGRWRCERIDGGLVEAIYVHKEIYYANQAEVCYVVEALLNGTRIMLDYSSALEAELECARTIAEYLGVPFTADL